MNIEIVKTYYFKDNKVDVVLIDDKEYWIVDQIARALECKEAHYLYDIINKRWLRDFEEGELLKIVKTEASNILSSDVGIDEYSYILLVNEEGLYTILFNVRTKTTKEFRRWFKREVLPSIRKKGYYISDRADLERLKLELELKKADAELKKLELEKLTKEQSRCLYEYSQNYPKEISAESQQALHAASLLAMDFSDEVKDIIRVSLPTVKKEYSATDISNILKREYGIEKSAKEIGKIASNLKIKDDPELCRIVPLVLSNEEGNVKEVSQFKYNEYAKDLIVDYFVKNLTTLEKFI